MEFSEATLSVKPYPIPDLEGKAAEDFERKNSEDPNDIREFMIKEGADVFARTKKYKNRNVTNQQRDKK